MFRTVVTLNSYYRIKNIHLLMFMLEIYVFDCELGTEPLCLRPITINCYVLHPLSKNCFSSGRRGEILHFVE